MPITNTTKYMPNTPNTNKNKKTKHKIIILTAITKLITKIF